MYGPTDRQGSTCLKLRMPPEKLRTRSTTALMVPTLAIQAVVALLLLLLLLLCQWTETDCTTERLCMGCWGTSGECPC